MPVGVADPIERLTIVRQRMASLKSSYEPSTTLGLFAALGYVPKMVQDQMLDLLASRATAVMTNVPGPAEPLTLAGSRLRQWVGWVPQSGDIGMGVSIGSYAGLVQFELITDAALTPDPEALVSRFPEEFETYLYSVLLRSPSAAEEAKTVPSPARGERESDIAEPSGASASAPARPARLARSKRRPYGPRKSGGGDARKRSAKRLRRRA